MKSALETCKAKRGHRADNQGDVCSADAHNDTEGVSSTTGSKNAKQPKSVVLPRPPSSSLLQPQKKFNEIAIRNVASSLDEMENASFESGHMSPTLEQQVLLAGSIIAHALRDGPWPSPSHMSMIGESLRKFCQDIVLKTMSGAVNRKFITRMETGFDERPFIGTLLMLREVLSQNHYKIFGSNGNHRQDKNQMVEAGSATFAAQVLATSVILYALRQQLGSDTLVSMFLESANEYDENRGSFTGLLSPYIHKRETESQATNLRDASFALHASKHSLVASGATLTKRRKDNEANAPSLPEPNAVHMTLHTSVDIN